jgi:hypothetical protein
MSPPLSGTQGKSLPKVQILFVIWAFGTGWLKKMSHDDVFTLMSPFKNRLTASKTSF